MLKQAVKGILSRNVASLAALLFSLVVCVAWLICIGLPPLSFFVSGVFFRSNGSRIAFMAGAASCLIAGGIVLCGFDRNMRKMVSIVLAGIALGGSIWTVEEMTFEKNLGFREENWQPGGFSRFLAYKGIEQWLLGTEVENISLAPVIGNSISQQFRGPFSQLGPWNLRMAVVSEGPRGYYSIACRLDSLRSEPVIINVAMGVGTEKVAVTYVGLMERDQLKTLWPVDGVGGELDQRLGLVRAWEGSSWRNYALMLMAVVFSLTFINCSRRWSNDRDEKTGATVAAISSVAK